MSFWDWFKPKPKPPKPPDPPPPSLEVHCTIRTPDGSGFDELPALEGGPITLYGEMGYADGVTLMAKQIGPSMISWTLPAGEVYGKTVPIMARAFYTNTPDMSFLVYPDYTAQIMTAADIADVRMPAVEPSFGARVGLVRLSGPVFSDDSGQWHPLGTTLFWALYGWKMNDRDRVKQNLSFVAGHGFDYVRILGQVDWSGETIDPSWPDYEQQLGELIDCAYDDYGLRVQITAIGGGCADPAGLGSKILNVVTAGRQHKVILLEGVNEGNASEADTAAITDVLKRAGVPCAVGRGDQGIDAIKALTGQVGVNACCYHTDRSDDDARRVRQAWDLKEFNQRAAVNNEPPGPASSVKEMTDPFRLAAFRTLSILCGGGMFCFHTGSGIYGKPGTASNGTVRQANLWETPNIDAMMVAVRAADRRLPAGIEAWAKANDGWTAPNPSLPITISGQDKHYGCVSGSSFYSLPEGCTGPIWVKATRSCSFDVYDPSTGDPLGHYDLTTGQSMQIAGLWAYLFAGTAV